jgi:hypothetical protein
MSVLGWCLLAAGVAVLWLLIVFVRLMTRAAVSPREAPDWRDRMIEAWPPETAPPTVARAALTPDCPSLDSEFWRANPTEPLAPSEVVRFKAIADRYEWVASAPVVPGGES